MGGRAGAREERGGPGRESSEDVGEEEEVDSRRKRATARNSGKIKGAREEDVGRWGSTQSDFARSQTWGL